MTEHAYLISTIDPYYRKKISVKKGCYPSDEVIKRFIDGSNHNECVIRMGEDHVMVAVAEIRDGMLLVNWIPGRGSQS